MFQCWEGKPTDTFYTHFEVGARAFCDRGAFSSMFVGEWFHFVYQYFFYHNNITETLQRYNMFQWNSVSDCLDIII